MKEQASKNEIVLEIQHALKENAEDIYIFWAGKCRLHITKDMITPLLTDHGVQEITPFSYGTYRQNGDKTHQSNGIEAPQKLTYEIENIAGFLTYGYIPTPMVVIEEAGQAWVKARSAMINMPMNSPDYREKLNALSNAENNLVAVIRTTQEKIVK